MKRNVSDPIVLRQQIQLEQVRKMEEEFPETWQKGMTNEPPYIAELEGESPKPPDPLTKDGSKVSLLAHLLQEKVIKASSRLQKSAPVITLGRAKDLIFAQLTEKRRKPGKLYKPEEIFNTAFLETKPQGVRHEFIAEQEAL